MNGKLFNAVAARLSNPKMIAAESGLQGKVFAHACLRRIFAQETARRTEALKKIEAPALAVIPEDAGVLQLPPLPSDLLNAVVNAAKLQFANTNWEDVRNHSEKKYLLTSRWRNTIPSRDDPVFDLALYPPLVKMLGNYLGILPVIENILLWNSPNDAQVTPGGSQFYHLDGQDVRTLQMFIFLNDIDQNSGPLKVVNAAASTRIANAIKYRKSGALRRIDDAVVEKYANADEIISLTGKAGTIYIADTDRCFHYGSRGGSKPRNQLVFQYYSPYAFAIPLKWWQALPYGNVPLGQGLTAIDKLVLGQQFAVR